MRWNFIRYMIIGTVLTGGSLQAQDAYYETSIGAQIVKVWIPGGVPILRGALTHLRDTNVVREEHQIFARNLDFCVIGGMIDHGGEQDASGPAAVFKSSLKTLAQLSGHPELEFIPIVHIGFSNGGWMAINLAKEMAEQTVCVAMTDMPGLSHDTLNAKHVAAFQRVPVSQIINSEFSSTKTWVAQFNPALRSRDYVYCLAMEWGLAHDYGNSNALQFPFIQQICAMRLPDVVDTRAGLAPLKDVSLTAGFLGDNQSWNGAWPLFEPYSVEKGRSSRYVWIANEHVAYVWRAFSANNRVNKLTVTPSGTNYTFAVSNVPDSIARIEFFDGNVKLGETASPTAPYLYAGGFSGGGHAIHAILTYRGGTRQAVNPYLLLLPKNSNPLQSHTTDVSPAPARKHRGGIFKYLPVKKKGTPPGMIITGAATNGRDCTISGKIIP